MAKQPTCSGMIGFGATARYVYPCDVNVFDDYTDRLRVWIEPKNRERDKPVCLTLDRTEALSFLRRLSEVLRPQSDFAES